MRLDQALVVRGLTATRSQAAHYIALGRVEVNGRVVTKTGFFIANDLHLELAQDEQFVSRAGLKLASVADKLGLDFAGKVVLDVGSSTGGFTDFALRRGAKKIIAVDVGTDQLHPSLRHDPRVELHEKTDIRKVISESSLAAARLSKNGENVSEEPRNDVRDERRGSNGLVSVSVPDIIVIDVSFVSLREILPNVAQYLAGKDTQIVAMVKPQFETGTKVKNAGIVKNDTERRRILRDFETWAKKYFLIRDKADSAVTGTNGNRERFYLLAKAKH
jgi:23S rRNA (cytidine1920-2'-O)/16S rRNA (cytidine1409-2'-O)-methyltransferase